MNIQNLGQVFTPEETVMRMIGWIRNQGRILEPAAGNGAFLKHLDPERTESIEIDPKIAPQGTWRMDFFQFQPDGLYDTIIGNPPFVQARNIPRKTRKHLDFTRVNRRANLSTSFIDRCIELLAPGGELIFITPRHFLKASSAVRLNEQLHQQGSFTRFEELKDQDLFPGRAPSPAIWRWEKGRKSKQLDDGRWFCIQGGQIWFGRKKPGTPRPGDRLGDHFAVRVGAASGADRIFTHEEGNLEFVYSRTRKSGETRRMIYNTKHPALKPHKAALLARRIRAFNESNWWEWGRRYPDNSMPRIYVNTKTRHPEPFFLHPARAFDGSILALFPKRAMNLEDAVQALNETPWNELGFRNNGRALFTQRALQNAPVRIP